MGKDVASGPWRQKLRRAAAENVLLIGVVFASTETLLVQWTSDELTLELLGVGLAATFLLFSLFAACVTALRFLWHRLRKASADDDSFLPVWLSCLALYLMLHLRVGGLLPISLPILATLLLVALAACILIPAIPGVEHRGQRVSAPVLLFALSVLWIVQAPLESDRILIAVLLCTGAAVITGLAGRHCLRRRPNAAMAFALPIVLTGVNGLMIATTYVIAQRVTEPNRDRLSTERPRVQRSFPSVILVVLDTVRADHTSLHGYEMPTTPNLDVFASQATAFTRAYANSTFSLPSHASLLTGLLPAKHGANLSLTRTTVHTQVEPVEVEILPTPLLETVVTIPEYLGPHGIRTALISANNGYLTPGFGLQQGFDFADSPSRNLTPIEFVIGQILRNGPREWSSSYLWLSGDTVPAPEIIDRALEWLDRAPRAPFFLMLNFMDAHEFGSTAYAARRVREIQHAFPRTPVDSREVDYDLSIRYLDYQLKTLLDGLRARGAFDDSLIIFTSDHGEELSGDGFRHGRLPSESQIHVPLVVKAPGQRQGRWIDSPVHGVDILPTIMTTLGLDIPGDLDGTPLGQGEEAVAEVYFARETTGPVYSDTLHTVRPSAWALVQKEWKLMLLSDGTRHLTRPLDDPAEQTNLADAHPLVAARMEERLKSLLPSRAFTDYLLPGPAQQLDESTLERLRGLGYIR